MNTRTKSRAETLASLLARNRELREAFYAWIGTLTDCTEDQAAFVLAFDLRMQLEAMQKALVDTNDQLTMALGVIADLKAGAARRGAIH